jgi:hypothetical protein
MQTRSSAAGGQTQRHAVSGKGSIDALRANSHGQAAHGILVAALLLGGFAVVPVAASGYTGSQVSAHHRSDHIRHKTMSDLRGSGHITENPWMY